MSHEQQKPSGDLASKRATLVAALVASALLATCLIVGTSRHLIGPLWHDLMRFLTGAGLSIEPRGGEIGPVVLDSLASVIVTIPLALSGVLLLIATGANKKIGRVEKPMFHECPSSQPAPKGIRSFFMALNKVACVVLLEEFYARWIFLGVLAHLAIFSGPNWFYLLFLIGNLGWTLLHYFNYKKGERTVLALFPVFFIGCMEAVMFLRYGLLGAFVSHVTWDYVLMVPRWTSRLMQGRPITL